MNEFIKKKIIAEKAINPIIQRSSQTERSGIYLYERTDECGITYFYIGQAINIYERQIGHWNGYEQRLDFSLRKRKFYSPENVYGWKFAILEYCPKELLDERENFYILKYMQAGKQTYNRTYGSQGIGKVAIDKERKQSKGYYDGLKQGYLNARREIAKLFKSSLIVEINGNDGVRKQNALAKFNEFIKVDTDDEQ